MLDGLPLIFPAAAPPVPQRPLIVDSFAGGGGASTGIEMALGRSPDIAINHSPEALALHAANHPDTLHINSNIWQVDPEEVCQGRPVGLLWASPDCTDHSKAKGGAPRSPRTRDLAWVVVLWARKVRPQIIMLENVEEFRDWSPMIQKLDPDGQPVWLPGGAPFMVRDPAKKGWTFRKWVGDLKRLGYKVEHREIRGSHHGDPTIRKRFFLVARCDGQPIVWPEATHGTAPGLLPYRTAAECIDWTIPCPSIFDTAAEIKARYGVRAKRPLVHNTLARLARGVKRYVLEAKSPFMVTLTHGGRLVDPAAPMPTVTAAHRGEVAVVAPSITRFNGGAVGQDAREPLGTITANGWHKRPGGAAPLGVLAAFLAHAQQGGAVRPAGEPIHTITASPKDQNQVIAATLVQTGYGERPGQAPRCLDLSAPLGTVVAGGVKHAAGACFIAQQNGGPRMEGGTGRDPRHPLSTVTVSGSQQTPVAAFLAKYYGTAVGQPLDEPCHTITVEDRLALVDVPIAAPPFSDEHKVRARQVAEFLRAFGAWDGGEFVEFEVAGETYVIVDLGLRMLQPRELFNCQGFPPDYVIEGVWREAGGEWTWHPFTTTTQVSCCGNSVNPGVAAALVRANCSHLAEERIAA